MMEVYQNRAAQPLIRYEDMECESQSQNELEPQSELQEMQQMSPQTHFRYRRYNSIKIKPIDCQSSSEDGQNVLNFECTTNLNIPTTTVIRERIQEKKEKIKLKRKIKKKEKKSIAILKKKEFLDDQQWDKPYQWGLPEECLRINRQHKTDNYNQLLDNIVCCVQGKSKIRTIFINGHKDTAKKTILFDVLQQLKSKTKDQQQIKQYFMSFEQQLNNNIQRKLDKLHQFLMNTVSIPSKILNDSSENDQFVKLNQSKCKKLKTILILDDYKSFVFTLKQSNYFKKIKKLLHYNTSNLLLFIDSSINKKEIQMITPHNFIQINIFHNSRQYFAISLTTAVNNYPYKNGAWELTKPLASFFSVKMEDNNKLRLSIIRKLILFLQNLNNDSQSKCEKRRVNHQILDKFTQKFVDRIVKIDLKRLTIHQKAAMSACYTYMKQFPDIFIPIKKLYKLYVWICQSIIVREKSFQQFTHDVVFQLSIYKFIKVEKRKSDDCQSIMLKIDIDVIKDSLEDENILSKFFKKEI